MTLTATHALPAASKNGKAVPPQDVLSLPLSYGQERLWLREQLQPGFNIPFAVRFEGPLDAAVVQQAVNQILCRHQILRTRFDVQNGEPVQIVVPALTVKLPVVDLQSQPPNRRETEARRVLAEEARSPFDLTRLPLLRARLLRLAPREHIFVLTVHPIIFDHASFTIFFRELAAIYERIGAGKPANLPAPPMQYRDFAVRQRERLRLLGPQVAWWKRRLSGGLPTLELPTDRPRPAGQTYHGAVESLALPGTLRTALESLSRQTGATLFMSLVAAFKALLHRYTGQDEVVIGSTAPARGTPEAEQVIGMFTNLLVLQCNLTGNPTVRQLLDRVRTIITGAHANSEVPFEKLIAEFQPERSLSHPPLFQLMFALERAPLEPIAWSGVKLTPLELDTSTEKFDLALRMVESANGLTARMEYNTDLFDSATIRRMLTRFEAFLEGIVRDPDQHLCDLPLLTEQERHQVVVEWNRTKTDYPRDKTIQELFEAQVARTPDAVAVVSGDQCLTYRELDGNANQLAHFLRRLGVQPDRLVGLCLERSLCAMIAVLGVLKAGGAYVPLDPNYPEERLAFMLKDSRVSVLLSQRQLLNALPRGRARRVCLDSEWRVISSERQDKPKALAAPENLAYVIYTSSSAGTPKGVQIPHRAVVNLIESMRHEPGLSSTDTMLALAPWSFDIAIVELFLPLAVGARVVLATHEEASDPARLAARIDRDRITAVQSPPATWRRLLDSWWQGSKSLKVLCGGEAMSRELANRLLERCGELWTLYGPTETTVWSSVARTKPGEPIVIGRPIANTRFYVLDRYFQPVPPGVPGELFIGGEGLSRGYLNRPELTAGKFVRDPFDGNPAARLYRTGDLARHRTDGNIELLGRADRQVKIGSHRIEPGEIEAMLLQFPQVREAVVMVQEETPGDKQLVAYLTTYRQITVSLNELRRFLREKLPDYMVPTAIVMLDKLPLTPDGKMDRRALPAPESHRSKPETRFALSRGAVEQTIAAVWEEVLSIKNPGVNENFFDLGGHSPQVMQVQTQLHERVGADLPVLRLFEYPTIRSLAGFLTDVKRVEPFAQRIHERARRQKIAAGLPGPFGARVKL